MNNDAAGVTFRPVDLLERSAGRPARHPWELARAHFVVALMRGEGSSGAGRWHDVGGGGSGPAA